MSKRVLMGVACALVAAALLPGVAFAGPTAAAKCRAGKNSAAGSYAACRAKAEAVFAIDADLAAWTSATGSCQASYDNKWASLETAGGADCPTTGDGLDVRQYIEGCSRSVATGLAGGTLLPDGLSGLADTESCFTDLGSCNLALSLCNGTPDGAHTLRTGATVCSNDAGAVILCGSTGQDGELLKGQARSFTDNGNGTVTDNGTNLMWEKLSDDGSIHDYTTTVLLVADAYAKIATLNTSAFGGHSDWRLPNRFELETLVNLSTVSPATYGAFNTACAAACTVTTCSCTNSTHSYFSSTTDRNYLSSWAVSFFDGRPETTSSELLLTFGVRAVRGGA